MNHKRVRTKIVLAGLIHFIIALIYRHLIGLSNTDGNWIDKWESMWQAIPLNQLSESPFTSIYYFHAQPPVFNIVQAALVKLVPNNPFELLQTVYILLGVVMVMMSGVIIYHLILRQIVGDILLFIITLHASLFIYEAYELQTHLTAFLVIVVIFCLVQLSQTKHYRYLYLAMLMLNILILTDSFFQPFLLILFGLAFVIWTPNNKLKVAFGLLLTSSITILFLLKNLLLFGFLGLNSGHGLDLYNMVQWEYTAAELEQLAEEQVIDPALSIER